MKQILKSLFSRNEQTKKGIVLSQIEDNLNKKGIEFYKEEKAGWGTVIVFYVKGKKVFTNNILLGEIELRNYHTENSYHLM
jgi:hypothetical protein